MTAGAMAKVGIVRRKVSLDWPLRLGKVWRLMRVETKNTTASLARWLGELQVPGLAYA
jgi:hypothetical protein